ncbi:Hypothetical protein CAP_6162 [Chondromyces apiculatus DSM 436]|uniref:Uncharacterized protein n=2 Tax=Chondromyces apiculatus TaxID=51 RepID=A0A017T3Q4_9BACT|nr:Hypothetical protein CAP_6162 [Chondromyces apiculatus DSM 436]
MTAVPMLLLVTARAAEAAPPRIIEGVKILSGEHQFSELIVRADATLRVVESTGAPATLHVRAGRIVIESGGVIDASGAGYQGNDGNDGGEPTGSDASGKHAAQPGLQGQPGSGAGSAGTGARGVLAACGALDQAVDGGQSYLTPVEMLLPGSAGGAFVSAMPLSVPSRGGHGGGVVLLEAAEIQIDGEIWARGGDGLSVLDLGSGGGAGGAIQLRAALLSGGGVLSVRGGAGGTGTYAHGGGGAGGVVVIRTGDGMLAGLSANVEGGPSGPCTSDVGGPGVLSVEVLGACLDADRDGHPAALCGGDDCDDGDPEIAPSFPDDRCDGVDNDCDGTADQDLSATACPDNHTCEAGECVASGEGGGSGGGPAGSLAPARMELRGGCGVGTAEGSRGENHDAGTSTGVGMVMLGALICRRRIVRRSKVSYTRPGGP